MSQLEQKHSNAKIYLTVWFWLFVLSFIAYFIDMMHLSFGLSAVLFTLIALMKVGLIAAYFMHLRFEKLNLVYAVLSPLILLVALVAALLPEAASILGTLTMR